MKCPHCLVEINADFNAMYLGQDSVGHWGAFKMICPNPDCKKMIVKLTCGQNKVSSNSGYFTGVSGNINELNVLPISSGRKPVPIEVDAKFALDYTEACLVLPFSPKASAALSRRCLQNILRDKAGVKHSDLASEIQEIINTGALPSHLSESIDAIRNIGNFAAHPIKSQSSGEVVPVEPGEAEWLLDVLEALFDFYFVQPAVIGAKRAALNQKLTDAKKPPMK